VAAGALAVLDPAFVLGRGQEHQGIAVLLVDPATRFLEAELVAVEVERLIEVAHAQHGVQISHGVTSLHRLSEKTRRTTAYMLAPDVETAIGELQELVEAARVVAPFTGGGISTECGIPDFRSPGGLWTKNRPIPFDEFLASQQMRDEAWRRRFAMHKQFA